MLGRKINSLTSIKTDSPQFLEALDAVATFQASHKHQQISNDDNDEKKSKSLRRTRQPRQQQQQDSLRVQLEQHGQILVEEFLDSFEPLRTKLYELEATVQDIDESSKQVEEELEKVKSQTSTYITVLNSLQEEQIILGRRSKLIEDFLETARLSDEETNTLRTCDFSNDKQTQLFFDCLVRLKHVRSLENELSTGWARTAGLQLVAKTSTLQSIGYERLFLWVRNHCDVLSSKPLARSPSSIILPHVKRGMRMLHHTPAYFEQCCVAVVTKQRADVRVRFIDALMHGDGMTPPIEEQSHDSLRFVGDMLAWVHGTIASEIDRLWSLFDGISSTTASSSPSSNPANPTNPTNPTNPSISSAEDTSIRTMRARVEHLIPTTFDDMAAPFKARLQQVARNEIDFISCYRLYDLLQFYYDRLIQILPVSSMFIAGVGAATSKVQSQFHDLLQSETSKLLHTTTIYPTDLSVAMPVRYSIEKMIELCTAKESSISGGSSSSSSSSSDENKRAADHSDGASNSKENSSSVDSSLTSSSSVMATINVEQVVSTVIESVQYACQASASGLDTLEREIYVSNNYDFLLRELSPFQQMEQVESWVSRMKVALSEHLETLATDVATKILKRHELSDPLEKCRASSTSSTTTITTSQELMPKLLSFSTQLFRMENMEKQFQLIGTSELREKVENMVRTKLANAYETLYKNLSSPEENLYTAEQVRTLLNI